MDRILFLATVIVLGLAVLATFLILLKRKRRKNRLGTKLRSDPDLPGGAKEEDNHGEKMASHQLSRSGANFLNGVSLSGSPSETLRSTSQSQLQSQSSRASSFTTNSESSQSQRDFGYRYSGTTGTESTTSLSHDSSHYYHQSDSDSMIQNPPLELELGSPFADLHQEGHRLRRLYPQSNILSSSSINSTSSITSDSDTRSFTSNEYTSSEDSDATAPSYRRLPPPLLPRLHSSSSTMTTSSLSVPPNVYFPSPSQPPPHPDLSLALALSDPSSRPLYSQGPSSENATAGSFSSDAEGQRRGRIDTAQRGLRGIDSVHSSESGEMSDRSSARAPSSTGAVYEGGERDSILSRGSG